MPANLARKHYIAYACICLIWGSTWGAIRLVVRDVPAFRAAATRFLFASIILLAVACSRKGKLNLSPRQWYAVIILGFTMMALPYGLLFWAEYRINSSTTAVLFSSCPLVTALLTPVMMRAQVPRRAVFAMLIGLGGIATLFYAQLSISPYVLLGGVAVIGAVLSSSWASVFAKRELAGVDPVLGTAVQFCIAAIVLFAASVITEHGHASDWNRISISALGFLIIFGSVIAFSVYYWLLKNMQAYQLSTINLVVPIVAMIEGAVLLREPIPLIMGAAAVLVLASVFIVLRAEDERPATLGLNASAGIE